MKANEAVRSIMKQQGVGATALASRIQREPRVVTDRLAQKNISIEKLDEMLRALDYKIVIVPRAKTVKAEEYEVE